MPGTLSTFSDLLAPFSERQFFAEYHDRRPLHIRSAAPDKFASVMSWRGLNQILNMTAIWSPESFQLAMDHKPIPPTAYCREAVDRANRSSLQPDAKRVKALLQQGASLVANDIDSLTPGLANTAGILEQRLGGKTQANLYCSWRQRPAFDTHFDTHEVFALHVEGEKTWRVYEGRVDRPIAHPAFKRLDQNFHEANRGAVLLEVNLKPGDLLYIPRGQYHDALASSEGTIHVAFGVTHVIGMDFLNILQAHAVSNPAFRSNFPPPQAGKSAMQEHLAMLIDELVSTAKTSVISEDIARYQAEFGYPRGGYDLPKQAHSRDYTTAQPDLCLTARDGRPAIETTAGTLMVPPKFAPMVEWALATGSFDIEELRTAFPEAAAEQLQQMLEKMTAAGILRRHIPS